MDSNIITRNGVIDFTDFVMPAIQPETPPPPSEPFEPFVPPVDTSTPPIDTDVPEVVKLYSDDQADEPDENTEVE